MIAPVLAAIVGYLLGSIPFGLLLARLAGYGDIRDIGSGSIGATNVLRTGAKGIAAATLALDLLKGTGAVLIGWEWGEAAALAAATAVIVGHMFPVWLGFRGGKGGATGLGLLLVLAWPVALCGAAIWLATALAFRYSSLATLVAVAAAAALAPLIADGRTALVVIALAILVILRHHENIRRLIAGEESRISLRRN